MSLKKRSRSAVGLFGSGNKKMRIRFHKKGNLGNPENSWLEREHDEFQTGPSSGSMLGFPGCRRLSGKKQHTCWEHEKDFHTKFS